MKIISLAFVALALSTILAAQNNIPVGTILPISLNSSLNSKRSIPGQPITAKIEQDVPVRNREWLKAGTKVLGEIVAVVPSRISQPATMTLRFTSLVIAGKSVPISTDLRAIASPLDVQAAETQSTGFERGSPPPWSQNTVQIGGDAVYRETGIVERRGERVGESVFAGNWGVLARVSSDHGTDCRGSVAGNDNPQALWVFSHDACGVYGLNALIKYAGPEGQIVLESTKGDLNLRTGTALLLRINASVENMKTPKAEAR
ncbi:MAG TPA: hypothetical protein VM578_01135 [Candidatus Saccharimonadales bacterium]|nr:hypothetical protein [Candidatus Saccharimonadales bacterium]